MLEVVQVPKEQMDEKFLADLHKSIFDHALPGYYFRYDLCMIAKNENRELNKTFDLYETVMSIASTAFFSPEISTSPLTGAFTCGTIN